MKLIRQDGYSTGCQQSCLAMLAGVTLEEIIYMVGPQAMGHHEFMKVCDHFKIAVGSRWIMEYMGGTSLGGLVNRKRTCVLSQAEAGNINYAHAVLLHKGQLADPFHGMNPSYPWRRWFYSAIEILDAPMIETELSST